MSVEHTDIAAYSLGLLDAREQQEFEAHLAGCDICAAELAEFAAMADLFVGVDQAQIEPVEPDESAVIDLLSRRAAMQRKRNRQRGWLAAAACLVLLAGGVLAGSAVGHRPSAAVALVGTEHQATNPASGIKGVVGLTSHPWGTQVILQLSHLRGPLECDLIAVSKSGQQRIMVGWLVPATGYGVPSNPADLLIEGGTSLQVTELASIKIQVVGGPTLLTIPV